MYNCLQFITHQNNKFNYIEGALLALEGGCKWLQLRMKNSSDKEREEVAIKLQQECKKRGSVFIIDDDVALAKKIGADGVHLGLMDMPISKARRVLGNNAIIGGTANTINDIITHYNAGANYVGCGPFRYTTTKDKLSPLIGLEGYKEILSSIQTLKINIPIVAIGGIVKEDIPNLKAIGINNIALSGAILNADNPINEVIEIIDLLNK